MVKVLGEKTQPAQQPAEETNVVKKATQTVHDKNAGFKTWRKEHQAGILIWLIAHALAFNSGVWYWMAICVIVVDGYLFYAYLLPRIKKDMEKRKQKDAQKAKTAKPKSDKPDMM